MILDPRLPALVDITPTNRQQTRRITRRVTDCRLCHTPITPDDVCFADGHDAHLFCAEYRNYILIDGAIILRAQDDEAEEMVRVEAKAIKREARGSDEWTTPTPAMSQ